MPKAQSNVSRGFLKTFEAAILLRIGISAHERGGKYDHLVGIVFAALAFEGFLNELAEHTATSGGPSI
jgi:phosphopantothenate synthetase